MKNEYRPTHKVTVRGATAPDETPWVEIAALGGSPAVWVKLDDLSDDAAAAKRRMRAKGLVLFGRELSEALDKARNVNEFPRAPLIEGSGWSGPYFTLRSGEIFSPDREEQAILLFEPQTHKCAKAGDKAWLKGVKRLGRDQPIVAFAVMIPFSAPILSLSRVRENFGFELSGVKGLGKSTLQRLAASTAGAALEPAGRNYWISANTTMNALEEQMPLHNDMPMIIEEMSAMYAGESDRVRSNRSKELVFRMASGSGKGRFQAARQTPARFVYLTSTNDPIALLTGANANDAAAAAADRLLAIPIAAGRKHGIFEVELPKGFHTGESAARAIDALVAENYGYPIRQFIQALVEARADDEDALKSVIEDHIEEFRKAVGVDGSQGSEARVADAFALVYAGGKLAQHYGALPKSLKCLEAAIYCYRINRDSVGAEISNVECLWRLSRRKGVVVVDLKDETKRYRKAVEDAPALILVGKKGRRELLLDEEALKGEFRDPKALFADPTVRPSMRHDRGRNSIKVKVTHEGQLKRFFCFRLPGADG
jgi:hypothetical protein